MIALTRTNSDNLDFQKLTQLFDDFLVDIDGDEHDFFAQYNQIYLDHVIVCDEDGVASGCGAFKQREPQLAEIKRIFVLPEQRGKGIATAVLTALENWARELGCTSCILETSNKLENAIALYEKLGYEVTENFGQYIGVESSVCMKKIIK